MTKTRDRILETSLQLFNEYGESNITTNHIANEMNISPGNLYYHFHNKDEIIYLLFLQFEQQMMETLEAPRSRAPTMEDMWLYLHLVFENVWRYRFLYRNLDDLLSRNKKLHTRFKRILERAIETAITICEGLVETGIMRASREEIEALAYNISVVATYWLNFQNIYDKHQKAEDHFGWGAYQVLALVTPFMAGGARELLHRLSQDYLH